MIAYSKICEVHIASVLIGVFALACAGAYVVIRHAVNSTIEHQALTVAEIVVSQAATARSVYAREIVGKLSKDGFGPSVNSAAMPGHVPIPAQFLKMVGRASSESTDRLYEYRPVSRWNLEPTQGLTDDFLRWAWPQLEAQDQPAPSAAIEWKAVSRIEKINGRRVLRYLSADPASQQSCAVCHNSYESTPEVVARRVSDGVPVGKQWREHQLLGALSITIPLDRAEQLAGSQINETAIFIFGILVASFLAMFWFNWRLTRQERSLRETENQLKSAELETRSANALLQANQGIKRAYTELSTYMRAIDQHAIVSVADRQGRIVEVNNKLLEISGFDRAELIGQDHRILSSHTHGKEFFAQMWAKLKRGEIWRGTICNRTKAGDLYWVDSTIMPLKDTSGCVHRYISIRIDITERKRAEQDMLRMATHDSLTGLANRSLLLNRIHQTLEIYKRTTALAAVLFIDLDQFKAINDSLGHKTGDNVLVEVAKRLTACARTEDTVARQGGDEFIVFMPNLEDAHSASAMAERLQRHLALPYFVDGHEVRIGTSIGIALFPDDGQDADTLLKNSDSAMYQVKDSGRNHYMFFAPHMYKLVAERYEMVSDMRIAAERGEFLLNFQPIMGMASGKIETMEVLLRWQHPKRGLVPPTQFIPLAEASGLIVPIGEWVIHTACAQIRNWNAAGLAVPPLAINLSAIQVHHQTIVERIAAILHEMEVDASALEFEITEGSLMKNTDEVTSTLRQLTELGLRIAIDDFGTGYSSLGYLKHLPIETLKIDRIFVKDIHTNADDAAIVGAMISMAHSLKLRVTAEGVETPHQLELLRELNCDQYQGFLASKPLSATEMARKLIPRMP
ncbi:MAG: PAS domain S-box-containing protein/diguanylate cyclase (GGDEF) domain-containing protein [Candidatus Nitrotoga sp. MKT]|nr:MAG: PAS domain S-box-containing protein/diguanylate cyclase (GGDEF) domain-containing protein [Candidatus Nitrotoga sp. MKT]